MSDCNICYQSLLTQLPVNLTYVQHQRLRFFNAAFKGDIYDLVGLRGENFTCAHRFHLHCFVQFHSNYYLQEYESEEREVFICPAAYCRAFISGVNGFQVTKYDDYIREFSTEDPRVPIFNHPDVVNLTNDFIHGRTNIWEWSDPARSIAPNEPVSSTSTGSVSSTTTGSVPSSTTDTILPSSTDLLGDLIDSLENVDIDDVIKAAVILDDSDDDDEELMEIDAGDQVDPVTDCMSQLDLSGPATPSYSPPSPDFSRPGTPSHSPIPHTPPPSPTPSETSTVYLDPNFRVVREMMRHFEDPLLLSLGWTPSTTIHRAEGGVFVQFFHGFPINPHNSHLSDQTELNATYMEYMEDLNDHLNADMWGPSNFDPYVSVYRVGVRHIVAIFAALPRGMPLQYHPISFPKKQYIF